MTVTSATFDNIPLTALALKQGGLWLRHGWHVAAAYVIGFFVMLAREWVGPWLDIAMGLHRAARNYYYPGFHEPGTGSAVGINRGI